MLLSHVSIGGHALLERRWQESGEEPEDKQPELFDIHVMMFADRSSTAVVALQRAFALERAAAERLLGEAPVVVKRAATPEVAAALLDALGHLGAQVVLLPSALGASDVAAESPAPLASGAAAQNAASDENAAWGGLDLGSEPVRGRQALDLTSNRARAAVASQPPVSTAKSNEQDAQADSAAVAAARYARAQARARELEREHAAAGGDDDAAYDEADAGEFVFGGAADEPSEPELEPELELELERTSLPRVPSRSVAPARAAAPRPAPIAAAAKPAVAAKPAARVAPPPRTGARPLPEIAPPRAPAPQSSVPPLGLGTVPPLPSAHPVRAAAPLVPRAAAPARAPAAAPRRAPSPGAHAEPARRAARPAQRDEPLRPAARVTEPARTKAGGDYWAGRRPAEWDAPARPPAAVADTNAGVPRPGETSPALQAVLNAAPPVPERSRSLALLEFLAGALVFGGGLYLDNSVLAGSATPASVVIHGFAIFGMVTGLLGLRP